MKSVSRSGPVALLLVLLALTHTPGSAFAQVSAVPPLMNFQGRLARPDGTPVADGNYSVRFSLWTAATAGTEKWSQTISPVAVRSGVFAALLDLGSGFENAAAAANLFNTDLWLEIKVGSDPALLPRQPLVSVPYAMKANSVQDGAITGASLANGTITASKFAANLFNPLAWLLGGNSGAVGRFLGTTDNQPLELRVNNRRAIRYQLCREHLPLGVPQYQRAGRQRDQPDRCGGGGSDDRGRRRGHFYRCGLPQPCHG